jgi:hypothetical protein
MEDKVEELLQEELVIINIGLRGFTESLEQQEVEVVQVDWIPPAGGDQEMIDILEKLM